MIMQEQNNGNCHYNNIVFAGEGEPTLRLASLLQLATSIKQSQQSATTTGTFTMRLVTNGLIDVTHIQSLYDCGISSVSVALMTSQSEQYESLMKPLLLHTQAQTSSQTSLAHERVCAFIRQAVDCGLQVEATATDRKDVDKQATEALATRLGAHTFRWRSFFP
jgi:molybdenum cofactor biosynthesis enzyme MoaA